MNWEPHVFCIDRVEGIRWMYLSDDEEKVLLAHRKVKAAKQAGKACGPHGYYGIPEPVRGGRSVKFNFDECPF